MQHFLPTVHPNATNTATDIDGNHKASLTWTM